MNVFVFEHLAGGGLLAEPMDDVLLAQGKAMLTAAASDFLAAGHEVSLLAEPRAQLDVEGATITTVAQADALDAAFDRAASAADAAVLIAPETGGALERWARRLEQAGCRSLGPSADAVAVCADKQKLHDFLAAAGVPVIPSRALDAAVLHEALQFGMEKIGGAWVVKPVDGAGSEQTFIVRTPQQAASLAEGVTQGRWVLQPYVVGEAVSASLIVHGDRIVRLRAGAQQLGGENVITYRGGRIPLDEPLETRALALAERAVAAVPGLRGFVGVDLILAPDSPDSPDSPDAPADDLVVEINPRLTVSYCGLRRLCATNLAAAMLDADAPIEWSNETVKFGADGEVK